MIGCASKEYKKIDGLRRRYSRAGLEEVVRCEDEDEEAYNRKLSP